jgi:hypothetical protein
MSRFCRGIELGESRGGQNMTKSERRTIKRVIDQLEDAEENLEEAEAHELADALSDAEAALDAAHKVEFDICAVGIDRAETLDTLSCAISTLQERLRR